ncbi:MAG: hypothetical protein JWQ54_4527 [Mucilaginibacter sp.]|nr:hypothetical protein [Mucilaginibacter sp.]
MDSFDYMFSFWLQIEHVAFFVQFFTVILYHVQKTFEN